MQPFFAVTEGGFYFRPSDKDPSLGAPEMKKPLECVASGYSDCETAIAARRTRRM